MLAVKENEKEIERRLNLFLYTYKKYKNTPFYQSIKANFWEYVYSDEDTDIYNQVKAYLDIECPGGGFYKQHLENIKKRFDLNCTILEVGGGVVPSFAEKVAQEQLRIGKGKITVYDPELLMTVPRFSNMTLVRRNFMEKTKIKKYDLLLGILACEGAEVLVEKVCLENKDFYISLCDCDRTLKKVPIKLPGVMFQKFLIEKAHSILRKQGETLEVVTLENRKDPILIHKKNSK